MNLSKFISCQEVRESYSLYIYIYIYCVVVSWEFFCYTHTFEYEYFLERSILTHRWDLNKVKVDLGVIAMKEYTTLMRSPELEPHHKMQFNDVLKTPICSGESLTSAQEIQHMLNLTNRAGEFYLQESKHLNCNYKFDFSLIFFHLENIILTIFMFQEPTHNIDPALPFCLWKAKQIYNTKRLTELI